MTQPVASTPPTQFRSTIWDWRTWAILVAVSLAMGLIGLLNDSLTWFINGQSPAFNLLTYWRLWVLVLVPVPLGALTWYLAERIRLERLHWGQALATHVLGALAVGYLRVLSLGLDIWLLLPEQPPFPIAAFGEAIQTVDPWSTFLLLWRTHFTSSFLWYWTIVAIHYALRFHTEAQERLRDAAQLRSRLVEARLHALRSQLNPHFLYNVLNSISVLAQKNDPNAVTDVVDRLGSLLRIALDDTRPASIPLHREMEFVEGYLAIERVRFADRLSVRTEISPDAARALVPAMILQPLVENAVKHAVAMNEDVTTVTIMGERDGDALRLRVSDSGPGFQPDRPRVAGRIGLATTAERLQELYTSAHSLTIGETPGGGATVTIEIPYTTSMVPRSQGSPETATRAARAASLLVPVLPAVQAAEHPIPAAAAKPHGSTIV